jgi:hypothetical protein
MGIKKDFIQRTEISRDIVLQQVGEVGIVVLNVQMQDGV